MRLRWRRRTRRKPYRRHETLVRIARTRESHFARRGAGGEGRARGSRRVRGRRPPSAPARRRAPRGLPQPVYVVSPRRRRDAQRGVRKEVRRESPRMARGLRESPAAHRGRSPGGARRSRSRGQQLRAARAPAPPGTAAGGALGLPRRPDPGRGARAPRMGLGPVERVRPGLQHAARQARGPARVLRRPPRSALERKARHRGLRRGLVCGSRSDPGRRKGLEAVSRPGGEERPVGPERAQPARADGGLGRSAVRAHRLQFHRRAAQRTGRAARVVHAFTGSRTRQRVRGDPARAAPACGPAVLRIHDRRRRPADPRGAQIRSDEQEDPNRAGSELPENHRPGDSGRSGRALGEALRGNHREGKQVTLLIDNETVARVLTPAAVRGALESAYRDLASGEAVCRPRIDIRIPTRDPAKFYQWGSMEGGSTGGYFAIRMKSDVVYEREYEGARTREKYCSRPGRYCGLVFLTDVETGEPLAIINDGTLQHLRVAADSAIGTGIMAREDCRALGLLGSGGMARSHVEALLEVRRIERLKVFSPTRANRERFAAEIAKRHEIECEALESPREVYRGADILAACTDSAVPVIRGEWLEAGMHVVSIGGRPDDAALSRFDRTLRLGTAPAPVGRPELATADEYLGYIARPKDPRWETNRMGRRAPQVTGKDSDVSFGDVVEGRVRGRTSRDQITYSERGNIQGAQFFAVAAAAYEAARREGLGRDLPTDWFLQGIRD